jgi:hypothetical protein
MSDPRQLSSSNENLPLADGLAIPTSLAVGDRFEKCGRKVIQWRIEAITRLPHVGRIVTFAEIDGTAHVQVRAPDIFNMGFYPACD